MGIGLDTVLCGVELLSIVEKELLIQLNVCDGLYHQFRPVVVFPVEHNCSKVGMYLGVVDESTKVTEVVEVVVVHLSILETISKRNQIHRSVWAIFG